MTQRRRAQTLNVFVKALEGTRVVVELRRDTIVRGLLQEVDSEMNLTLVDVTCRALEGKAQELEFLYVKGRSVRYIHFPGSVNAASLVEDKRRSAKQARLAHARELGAAVSRPKGWQGPAAGGLGSGSGLAPGGAGDCAEASGSEGAGGVEPMDSCEGLRLGGEWSGEELTNAAHPMQAEAPGSLQCALHGNAD